jgi:Uma2 family endonuclease
MLAERQRITLSEFERILAQPENRERLLELIDGVISEKMTTEEHGSIVIQLGALLHAFVKPRRLGRVSTEVLHQMPEDAANALRPDLAFISAARMGTLVKKGAKPLMPDLAVEIKSPGNTYNELRLKALFYLQHGSRVVWLIFPEKQHIEVYAANGDHLILTVDDVLNGGELLPEFDVAVRDVFDV